MSSPSIVTVREGKCTWIPLLVNVSSAGTLTAEEYRLSINRFALANKIGGLYGFVT